MHIKLKGISMQNVSILGSAVNSRNSFNLNKLKILDRFYLIFTPIFEVNFSVFVKRCGSLQLLILLFIFLHTYLTRSEVNAFRLTSF